MGFLFQDNAKDNKYKIKLQLKGLLLHLKDLIADLPAFTYVRGSEEE
jgi:hypothetical protein